MGAGRSGGLLGRDGVAARLVESAAKRVAGVDLHEEATLRERLAETSDRLVEAVGETRMLSVLNRRLGRLALNQPPGGAGGQDEEPNDRIAIAQNVRAIARKSSQVLYAVRLRNAFCFGQGVNAPRAPDEAVQEALDDLWEAAPNRVEFSNPEAQWRFGKDLWENCNVYFVVFAGLSLKEQGSGLDGRVLVGSLQHDQVRDVVRDPQNWSRVLYYVVTEWVYEYDYVKARIRPNPTRRTVYFEALDGMEALEEDIRAGRTDVPPAPPPAMLREGRVLHIALNRGKEQAFGEPEMRTILRWAAAFNDIMAGQVEKAKSAQTYLMKVRAKGARTADQLHDLAMRAVGRSSPLAAAPLDIDADPNAAPARRGAPGGQLWGNDSLEAEPFNLDSGAASAKQDLESAAQAFATGTNFPGHYIFGDPGSLAGSMAVELPVLKLTELDQQLVKTALFARLCDLRIDRARAVGLLDDRRLPTEDELADGIVPEPDGMIPRDFSYELTMPDPLRRNLPELMGLVSDTIGTFDPLVRIKPLKRALLGYALDLVGVSDAPALLERVMAADDQLAAADAEAEEEAALAASGGDGSFVGPDGRRHTPANPGGIRQKSDPVVEAEARRFLDALATVAASSTNGHGED